MAAWLLVVVAVCVTTGTVGAQCSQPQISSEGGKLVLKVCEGEDVYIQRHLPDGSAQLPQKVATLDATLQKINEVLEARFAELLGAQLDDDSSPLAVALASKFDAGSLNDAQSPLAVALNGKFDASSLNSGQSPLADALAAKLDVSAQRSDSTVAQLALGAIDEALDDSSSSLATKLASKLDVTAQRTDEQVKVLAEEVLDAALNDPQSALGQELSTKADATALRTDSAVQTLSRSAVSTDLDNTNSKLSLAISTAVAPLVAFKNSATTCAQNDPPGVFDGTQCLEITVNDPLQNDLVAYYRFSGNLQSSVGSGTGVNLGGSFQTGGPGGQYLRRDTQPGHGFYFDIGGGDRTDYTISFLWNPYSTACNSATDCAGILWTHGSPPWGTGMIGHGGGSSSQFALGTPSGTTSGVMSFSINTWYHFVLVVSQAKNAQFYIDGVLKKERSDNANDWLLSSRIWVANYANHGGNTNGHYALGSIDELAVWNRQLTENEIIKLSANKGVMI